MDAPVYQGSGYAVHVIMGTYLGRAVFEHDARFGETVIRTLRESTVERGVQLYCYCLMPDHLHFVAAVQPGGSDIATFVSFFKAQITRATKGRGLARLWQRSFYDHVIRKSEDLQEVCLCVVSNPVRKGLVDEWRSYPFAWLSEPV